MIPGPRMARKSMIFLVLILRSGPKSREKPSRVNINFLFETIRVLMVQAEGYQEFRTSTMPFPFQGIGEKQLQNIVHSDDPKHNLVLIQYRHGYQVVLG